MQLMVSAVDRTLFYSTGLVSYGMIGTPCMTSGLIVIEFLAWYWSLVALCS